MANIGRLRQMMAARIGHKMALGIRLDDYEQAFLQEQADLNRQPAVQTVDVSNVFRAIHG